MNVYKLSKRAWLQYQLNTRDNRDVSRRSARIKLSRNFALGQIVSENDTYKTSRYGYTCITLNKLTQTITDCHNEYLTPPVDISVDMYNHANDLLGLSERKYDIEGEMI